MPRFAANLTLLYRELPYADRFAAAARAGFGAAEVLFPYDLPPEATAAALRANNLPLVLFNAPPPGEAPAFPALPGGAARFRDVMEGVMGYARVLRPDFIHVMAGYIKEAGALEAFAGNLRWAAERFPEQRFTVEPLNSGDQPGYFLDDYALAGEVLDLVDHPNVGLQFDSYHAQVIHGDAVAVWEAYRNRVFHVQIGDAPGRTEPGRGTVDFEALFAAIDASGYDGWVSAEYNPTTERTRDSLGWFVS